MENIVEENEKLIVRNFGPLKNIEIVLKKYSLFIGPQGSGKSTILKLIAIFRDYNFVLESFKKKDSKELLFFENYGLKNYFVNNNPNSNLNTYIEYKSVNYSVIYTQGQFIFNKDSHFTKILERENEILNKLKHDYQLIDLFNIRNLKHGFSNLFSENATNSIYIPTERFLTSLISESLSGFITSNIHIPFSLLKFFSYFENARILVTELNVEYLKIRYKFEDNVNKVFFDDKGFLSLSDSASGYQSIIPLLLVIHYLKIGNQNNSFIIEEPELNLFPVTQKELIKEICYCTWSSNNSLVVATHSPYVLSSFSLLLFASQVANKGNNIENVKTIISEKSWINPNKFVSYYVADGTCNSIFNEETGLIGENELDEVSLSIGDDFDRLMQIYNSNN